MSAETGCGCSALELHDGRCAGCGRSVLERVSRPGRPGADYEVLLGEVERLRSGLRWIAEYGTRNGDLREGHEDAMRHIAFNLLAIDAVNCAPVESVARAVAPWCADHVRESEESRQPKAEQEEAMRQRLLELHEREAELYERLADGDDG